MDSLLKMFKKGRKQQQVEFRKTGILFTICFISNLAVKAQ